MNRGLGDDTCDKVEMTTDDLAAVALLLKVWQADQAWKPQHVHDDPEGWERLREAKAAITPDVTARLERLVADHA